MKHRFYLSILIVAFFFHSCSPEDQPNQPRGSVTAYSQAGMLSKADIDTRCEEFNASPVTQYGVTYYTIDYVTEYMGERLEARGLLILPDGVDTMVLASYTHGTLLPLNIDLVNNNLPSNYRGQSGGFIEMRNIALPLASSGFAVFLPDYVGFTKAADKEHPYVYYPELFNSILDGLRAAKNFIADQGFVQDNRVFLAGWSQGAGAAVSAHKLLEQHHAGEFTVVASSGLAGPYNFSRFLGFVFENKETEFPYLNIYSWALYTLNKFSSLKRPTDQLFGYPVYDQMSAILVPSKIPENVLNLYFVQGVISGTDTPVIQAMQQNSFHEGWQPQGKVFLHHGTADDIVPYFNSVDAEAGLTAAGGDVTLYSYPGGKHDTEVGNYALKTIQDFTLLK